MSDDATPRRPFWRDPFVIAFFAGIVLITAFIPFFRRVAPVPEVTGRLPAWSLSDQHGAIVSSTSLSGRVVVLGLASASQDEASRRVIAAFGHLEPRFRRAGADVALVLVDLDGRDAATRAALVAKGPASIQVVSGSAEAACDVAIAGFAPGTPTVPACEAAIFLAGEGRLLIVDGNSGKRGLHPATLDALPEAFERTLRVCDVQAGGS